MLSSARAALNTFSRSFSFIPVGVRNAEDGASRPRNVAYSIMEGVFGQYVPLALYAMIMTSLITCAMVTTAIYGEDAKSTVTVPSIPNPSSPVQVITESRPVTATRSSPPAFELILLIIFCMSFLSTIVLVVGNRLWRGSSSITPMRMSASAFNAPVTSSNASRLNQMVTRLVQLGRNDDATALRSRLRMALMNRDFNGNDYEMLQSLDDQNPHAGATEGEISRLPVHILTQANIDHISNLQESSKSCSICLAPYESGDALKTVICLVSLDETLIHFCVSIFFCYCFSLPSDRYTF